MNIDKAAQGLRLAEEDDSPVHDLVMGSLLYGGIRREPSGPDDHASMSPVASPNFEGAKHLLVRAFEKGYTMAAVQIGSIYMQEEKLAGGKNLNGQDPKVLAYQWYKKAADLSNPVRKDDDCFRMCVFMDKNRWLVIKLVISWNKALDVTRIFKKQSNIIKRHLKKVNDDINIIELVISKPILKDILIQHIIWVSSIKDSPTKQALSEI